MQKSNNYFRSGRYCKAGGGAGGGGAGGGGAGGGGSYIPTNLDVPEGGIAAKFDLLGGSSGTVNVGIVAASDGGYRAFVMQGNENVGARGIDTLGEAQTLVRQLAQGMGARVVKVK